MCVRNDNEFLEFFLEFKAKKTAKKMWQYWQMASNLNLASIMIGRLHCVFHKIMFKVFWHENKNLNSMWLEK